MKIIFFDKVICEGTEEECETFRKGLIDTLSKLDDELRDTYPISREESLYFAESSDEYQMYFEALQALNPFVYDTLCYIKELVGDYFIEFQFHHMDLVGVVMRIYADLETKRTKVCALSYIWFIIVFGLGNQTIWRMEE